MPKDSMPQCKRCNAYLHTVVEEMNHKCPVTSEEKLVVTGHIEPERPVTASPAVPLRPVTVEECPVTPAPGVPLQDRRKRWDKAHLDKTRADTLDRVRRWRVKHGRGVGGPSRGSGVPYI